MVSTATDQMTEFYCEFSSQIQHAMIQTFVWLVALTQMKAESNFVVKECGELCVMTDGIGVMQWWCADS